MFERLLKKASTLKRYLAAPLLEARLGHLKHRAQQDLGQYTLRQFAGHQAELVRILPLGSAGLERFHAHCSGRALRRCRR